MKNGKQQKVDHLLDEIGQIDDEFLTEAMGWHASRAVPRRNPIRALLVAATLSLVLVLALSATFSMFNRGAKFDEADRANGMAGEPPTLNSLLQNCTESGNFTQTSADDLNFFNGEVRLAVENVSTGELFVSRALTEYEQDRLERELKQEGELVPPDADTSGEFRVWVMFGDGSVLTPCLTPSAGNIGAAEFFDYDPEREPTQIFMNLLSGLI